MSKPFGFSPISELPFSDIAQVNKIIAYYEERRGHTYKVTHFLKKENGYELYTECTLVLQG